MAISKNFVVKNGLEVAENLIFTKDQFVGIGTTNPEYLLTVDGDLSITGGIYVPSPDPFVKTTTGIVSTTSLLTISGIDTSSLIVGDYLTGTYFQSNTRITAIGSSSLSIVPNHTNSSGLATTSITFLRYKSLGEPGQTIVSQGNGLPLIWDTPTSSLATTAITAINVIGGIASLSQLSVSGVSTFNSGIFSGSTTTDLVRITQTGTGNALRVEDEANPDSSPFVVDKDGKVGINTAQPNYGLDIRGTVLIGNALYVQGGQLSSRVGILSGTNRSIISGIDTSGIEISDAVDNSPGTEIVSGTVITSIGINSVGLSQLHGRFGSPISSTINIRRNFYAGNENDVLVSRGSSLSPNWSSASNSSIQNISTTTTYYPTFVVDSGRQALGIAKSEFTFISNPGNLGIGSTVPTERLDVGGNVKVSGSISVANTATIGFITAKSAYIGTVTAGLVTANTVNALTYLGNGAAITGIVTQITAGIGVRLSETQVPGKGVVNIDSYFPIGKTIFVTQNGNDNNSGLTESDAKKTIKAASNIAVFGDTIKVFPGVYVEENPIVLKRTVSVEGTELRNCVVTPKYPYLDLFHVNNGCHITDMSFIGPDMTDGASVVALQPLEGVAVDRYFDAARMIRFNLDYIAAETVGYLTSTSYKNPAFEVVNASGIATDPVNCKDDIKDIWKCIIHDITRGGNSKCVGAGLSYYSGDTLVHIAGTDPNGYSVRQATVDAIDYSFGVARAIINNVSWGGTSVGLGTTVVNAFYNNVTGVTTITATNHGLAKDDAVRIVGLGFTCPSGPGIVTYPTGSLGYIFNVKSIVDNNNFEVIVGQSTLPHTYVSGGTIQKYTSFQNEFTQVKDLAMQKDPLTGFNDGINGCANVVSAMRSCVGVVTSIVGLGSTAFTSVGIRTTYPGNSGIGFTTVLGITSAVYDNVSGKTTLTAPGLTAIEGESIELRGLNFSCSSGGGISTQAFPSGRYGFDFFVDKINNDGSFEVYVGPSTLPHTYVGGGVLVNRSVAVTTASYIHTTGITTIKATGLSIESGDLVRIRGLQFSCPSGPGIVTYPSGNNGYDFRVLDIITDKPYGITSAVYNNTTGITTITAPGIGVTFNDIIELRNLEFSCSSGAGTTTLYPTGNNGYDFRVLSSSGSTFTVNVGPSTIPHNYVSGGTAINRTKTAGDTFTINVGTSTLPHTYVGGGIAIPPFSKGVGPVTQGPYVRNCTNFIPKSIGMKVDGFAAEPGDQPDNGITGTMSVDSYTQYNQGGIGVSITNGAYAQLVSIFTICDDIAIFTGSGGQCDITNSNSSFGNKGLVSDGVGDYATKSIYRHTGVARTTASADQSIIEISSIGNLRPYDGQTLHFGELYYEVESITVDNGGFGYSSAPVVTIDTPKGPNAIRAEASSTIDAFGKVTSIDIISTGRQYRLSDNPKIIVAGPTGAGITATATLNFKPIYYTIESATLPSSGITTVTLNSNLNSVVSAGTTVYFNRLSLQIVSSHSFEWVGSGNNINTAKPALGGVAIQENEVIKLNGGEIVYTSTDQAGNFRIGDDVVINQLTGTISGRAFSQSLLNTVTPIIIALGN